MILKFIAIALLCFIGEILFESYKSYTDGLIYSNSCTSLESIGLFSGIQNIAYGSAGAEPVSMGLLYGMCYFGFEFSYVNYFTNIILMLAITSIFPTRYFTLIILLSITNYYFLLLSFGVYKLKVAATFYFLSHFFYKKRRAWIGFDFLSLLSHVQILPLYFGKWLGNLMGGEIPNIRKIRLALIFFVIGIAAMLFHYEFFAYLLFRLESYGDSGVFSWKLILLFIAHVIFFRPTLEAVIFFSMAFGLALIVGDGRLIVLYFLYLVVTISKILNNEGRLKMSTYVYLSSILIYSLFKAIPFVDSLISGISYFEQ